MNNHGKVAVALAMAFSVGAAMAEDIYLSPKEDANKPDSDYIQEAVRAVMAGETVYLSAGVYTMTNMVTVPAGVNLIGSSGRDVTILETIKPFRFKALKISGETLVKGLTVRPKANKAGKNPGSTKIFDYDFCGGFHLDGGGTVEDCAVTNVIHCFTQFSNGDYSRGIGATLNKGGTVRRCRFARNGISSAGGSGQGCGGVRIITSGLVEDCEIVDNNIYHTTSATCPGAGVSMDGGTVRNCLIARNRDHKRTSGVYATGGLVENCTIVYNYTDNASYTTQGGVGGTAKATFRNCIICGNYNANGVKELTDGATVVLDHCTTEMPSFKDPDNGDYRVVAGATIDTGVNNLDWMTNAKDLSGEVDRIVDGIVDLGCYEYIPSELACSIEATAKTGHLSLDTVLTAHPKGQDLKNLTYSWALFDGTTFQYVDDPTKVSVSQTYGPGVYAVKLIVKNAAGEAAEATETIVVTVNDVYVGAGTGVSPYSSPETATNDLAEAFRLAADGTVVHVAPGDYTLAETLAVPMAATIRGTDGPEVTSLTAKSRGYALIYMTNEGAALEGLTIKDTHQIAVDIYGGGVVSNCVLSGNVTAADTSYGQVVETGGAAIRIRNGKGRVYDTVFAKNGMVLSGGSNRDGGTVYASGSGIVFERCTFTNNTWGVSTSADKKGAVMCVSGSARIRNCLFANNRGVKPTSTATKEQTTYGTIAIAGSGTVALENCTVVSNLLGNAGYCAGIHTEETANVGITNCLVYGNCNWDGTVADLTVGAKTSVQTCFLTADGDPRFKHPNRCDYRLRGMSPCLNVGTDADWMSEATDLEGNPRIRQRAVDIGCYEDLETGFSILVR